MVNKSLIIFCTLFISSLALARPMCEQFLTKNIELSTVAHQNKAEIELSLVQNFMSRGENSIQPYYTRHLSTESYVFDGIRWQMVKNENVEINRNIAEVMVLHLASSGNEVQFRQSQLGKLDKKNQITKNKYYLEPLMSISNVTNTSQNTVNHVRTTKDTMTISYGFRERDFTQINERMRWKYRKVSDNRLLLTTEYYVLNKDGQGTYGEKQVSTILLTPVQSKNALKIYLDEYLHRDNSHLN